MKENSYIGQDETNIAFKYFTPYFKIMSVIKL